MVFFVCCECEAIFALPTVEGPEPRRCVYCKHIECPGCKLNIAPLHRPYPPEPLPDAALIGRRYTVLSDGRTISEAIPRRNSRTSVSPSPTRRRVNSGQGSGTPQIQQASNASTSSGEGSSSRERMEELMRFRSTLQDMAAENAQRLAILSRNSPGGTSSSSSQFGTDHAPAHHETLHLYTRRLETLGVELDQKTRESRKELAGGSSDSSTQAITGDSPVNDEASQSPYRLFISR